MAWRLGRRRRARRARKKAEKAAHETKLKGQQARRDSEAIKIAEMRKRTAEIKRRTEERRAARSAKTKADVRKAKGRPFKPNDTAPSGSIPAPSSQGGGRRRSQITGNAVPKPSSSVRRNR